MLQYEGTPISIDPTRAAPNSGAIPAMPAPAASMQPPGGGFARPAPESRQTNAIEELYRMYCSTCSVSLNMLCPDIAKRLSLGGGWPFWAVFPDGIELTYGYNCKISIEEVINSPDSKIEYFIYKKPNQYPGSNYIERREMDASQTFRCGDFRNISVYSIAVILTGPCVKCAPCPPSMINKPKYLSKWKWLFLSGEFFPHIIQYEQNGMIYLKLETLDSHECEICEEFYRPGEISGLFDSGKSSIIQA